MFTKPTAITLLVAALLLLAACSASEAPAAAIPTQVALIPTVAPTATSELAPAEPTVALTVEAVAGEAATGSSLPTTTPIATPAAGVLAVDAGQNLGRSAR